MRRLRLVLVWGDMVVSERVVSTRRRVTVGTDLRCTVVVPEGAGLGPRATLLEPGSEGPRLCIPASASGYLRTVAGEVSLSALRERSPASPLVVPVRPGDSGVLAVGPVEVVFEVLTDSVLRGLPGRPFWQRQETGVLAALLLATLLQTGPLLAAFVYGETPPDLRDLDPRSRTVVLDFAKPPAPEAVPEPERDKAPKDDAGKRAGGAEGQFGERDRLRPSKVPRRDGPLVAHPPKTALDVLNSNLTGVGSLQAIFSEKTTFSSKLNAAMSGDDGELVVGSGTGGMGLRGLGNGGGGEGVGRIRGMGRLDTGGGTGTHTGLATRTAEKPRVHVTEERPATQGFCREADIQHVVALHQNGVSSCYERELSRTPDLEGRMTVNWRIGLDGKVVRVLLEGSTLRNPTVEGCITHQIEHWTFAPPEGGMCQVRYPFVFNPGR